MILYMILFVYGICRHGHYGNGGNCEGELPEKPVGQLSADCWPFVGRLWVGCRPTVDRQTANIRPTVDQQF